MVSRQKYSDSFRIMDTNVFEMQVKSIKKDVNGKKITMVKALCSCPRACHMWIWKLYI